jgi:dihydropteroate synthase
LGGRRLLSIGDTTLDLDARTHIMGVLNITPDSFSDGGLFMGPDASGTPDYVKAIESALKMVEEGADIIDIGGESTRPGAQSVPEEEEIKRVLPVIEGIRRHSKVPVSIDTYKAGTARAAVLAGASIINDISAGAFDPEMAAVAAQTGAAIILMHIKGAPPDMQERPEYGDVVSEVRAYLAERADRLRAAGVSGDKILLDVGIGFGKTVLHNLALINRLDEIKSLGLPLVLGVSRKAFIGKLTGGAEASDRLEGTIAASVIGIVRGADIIRVHDVRAAKRAAAVADAIIREGGPDKSR